MTKAKFFNLNNVLRIKTTRELIDCVANETVITRDMAEDMDVKDLQKELLQARNRFNKALISNDY